MNTHSVSKAYQVLVQEAIIIISLKVLSALQGKAIDLFSLHYTRQPAWRDTYLLLIESYMAYTQDVVIESKERTHHVRFWWLYKAERDKTTLIWFTGYSSQGSMVMLTFVMLKSSIIKHLIWLCPNLERQHISNILGEERPSSSSGRKKTPGLCQSFWLPLNSSNAVTRDIFVDDMKTKVTRTPSHYAAYDYTER